MKEIQYYETDPTDEVWVNKDGQLEKLEVKDDDDSEEGQ